MSGKIITKGLNTGFTVGGVSFILLRGLVSSSVVAPEVTIRVAIIIAIVNQLKTINIANGYNTDIAENVVDWKLTNSSINDLPMVEVKDPSETTEIKGRLDYNVLSVELIGRIATTDMDVARNFLIDITEAMRNGPAYPVSVYDAELIEESELLPERRDKGAVKVSASYEIKYRE